MVACVLALAAAGLARPGLALAGEEPIRLVVDGQAVQADVPPEVVAGRVLVPLRVAAEQLGYVVSYDARARRVTLVRGDLTVELVVGAARVRVIRAGRAEERDLYVSARAVRGRTLVPVRFLAEILGAQVQWQPEARTVAVSTRAGAGGATGGAGGSGSAGGGYGGGPEYGGETGGGSSGSTGGGAAATEVVVTARGLAFSPAELRLKRGQAVTLVFRNEAGMAHTFTVDGIAVTVGGQARTGIHLQAAGGSSASLTFVPTATGSFEFYCAVPGHREYGMKGTLVVEP